MSTPRKSYFARHTDFEHDESAPLAQEFERLARLRNWRPGSKRYKQEKSRCIAEEFHHQFGRDDNKLNGWQTLCRDVGIEPPKSITQCKKVWPIA